ncbi:MAG: hypothetical protein AB7E70_19460 [Hyphomicrobiaceae bacterium]
MTPEEEAAFYDPKNWRDLMTDDQRRANRDSSVRAMLRETTGPFGGALGQGARIEQKTDDDLRIAAVIEQVKTLLETIATPEPKVSRARRRR